jgi:hypothetical protein
VVLACADAEDDAGLAAGSDDRVVRAGRAVHEIPLTQGTLLPFDDCERLAREDEKILLVGLPVVHRERLARLEADEADSDLREVGGALKADAVPAPFRVRASAPRVR